MCVRNLFVNCIHVHAENYHVITNHDTHYYYTSFRKMYTWTQIQTYCTVLHCIGVTGSRSPRRLVNPYRDMTTTGSNGRLSNDTYDPCLL